MKDFLNGIRKPVYISLLNKFLYSTLLFVTGIILGVISKVLDETSTSVLPYILGVMDLSNFLSRIGVWIFLAVLISVYSKSPIRSSLNVLLFFIGMVGSYYLYTVMIAGFFPKSYMMIWIIMTAISPFLAFVCWYAKGTGLIPILISSVIIMVISRQAFIVGFWYFDIRNILEFSLWIATIFVLFNSLQQIIKVLSIGIILFLLTSQIYSFWGML